MVHLFQNFGHYRNLQLWYDLSWIEAKPQTWVSNSSIATYGTGSVGKVPFNCWRDSHIFSRFSGLWNKLHERSFVHQHASLYNYVQAKTGCQYMRSENCGSPKRHWQKQWAPYPLNGFLYGIGFRHRCFLQYFVSPRAKSHICMITACLTVFIKVQ